MDSCLFQGHWDKVKCNQPCTGLDLGSLILFSMTITITLSVPVCMKTS